MIATWGLKRTELKLQTKEMWMNFHHLPGEYIYHLVISLSHVKVYTCLVKYKEIDGKIINKKFKVKCYL